ncbi:tigger transposable element-derived protein 1-like isoform X1 [Homarus americanus]|uniref:tigger transposable element-derived protein 1-like isoform X1 n=1 Tax=Homarus americanus TaxID=6706 RepID=UPI001C43C977|nr:tigger transposable element-derived protein 1-like isoform X1 [Homarus americanus]
MSKRPATTSLTTPKTKKSRQAITLEQKIKVLEALQCGNGASSVGRQFELSESSVRTIKLNEKKIRAAYASPDVAKGKLHLKSAMYVEMEDALKLWVEDMQRRKLSFTGPMLQNQAYKIQSRILEKEGKSIKDSKFTASTGWLYKFIKRTGLRKSTLSGEAGSADAEAAEDMKKVLKDIVEENGYSPCQVWNCDETGLYWKRMPKKTYLMKNEEKTPGFKVSKDRLTILLMANASGTSRMKPLVIHHSARPRALKNLLIPKLPVFWRSNKKAWMTSDIFDEWYISHATPFIENVNKKLNLSNKALILMDNASCHSKHLCSVNKDINLTFFPPNVTSPIQPLDQGVIALFKRYYLKFTMKQMAEVMSKDKNMTAATFWKSYTIEDAIANIAVAWKSVPESALNGVWRNLWPQVVHDFKGFDEDKDVKDILKLGKEVRGDSGFQEIQEEDVNELLVSMEEPLTSEEVLEMVEMAKNHKEEEEATNEPQTVRKDLTIPKLREFMQHVTSATQSALQQDPDMECSMQVVEALNRAASTCSQLLDQMVMAQQQKKITSFFPPFSSSAPGVAGPSTSGQTQPSSNPVKFDDIDIEYEEIPKSPPDASLDSDPVPSTSNTATPTVNESELHHIQYRDHVSTILAALAEDEAFMDVTLIAEGKPLKAHKSVLSAMSRYFRGVLQDNPCQHPIVIMPHDVLYEDLVSIITYIYKGEISVAVEKVASVLTVAKVLQIHGMTSSDRVSMDGHNEGSSVVGTAIPHTSSSAMYNIHNVALPKTEPLEGVISQNAIQNNVTHFRCNSYLETPVGWQQRNVSTIKNQNNLPISQNVSCPLKLTNNENTLSLKIPRKLTRSQNVSSAKTNSPLKVPRTLTSSQNVYSTKTNSSNIMYDASSVIGVQLKLSDNTPVFSKAVPCTAYTEPIATVTSVRDPQPSGSMNMEIHLVDLGSVKEELIDIDEEEL